MKYLLSYFLTFTLIHALPAFANTEGVLQEEKINNGEDVTHPVRRFDLRVKYQTGVTHAEGKDVIVTLRTDQLFYFDNEWELSFRVDIPYDWFYCPRNSRECNLTPCTDADHLDDSLLQIFLITPSFYKWKYAVGTKFIFPTGGVNLEIGDGKYQLLPSFAFRYDLNDWVPGSYLGAIFRYAFDYAGYKVDPHISQAYIQPFFNLNLPDGWFLNSSPEMFYDFPTHHWFIPFDLMIGKMLGKKYIVSIEYECAIIDDYPEYSQQVEFRVGYFF